MAPAAVISGGSNFSSNSVLMQNRAVSTRTLRLRINTINTSRLLQSATAPPALTALSGLFLRIQRRFPFSETQLPASGGGRAAARDGKPFFSGWRAFSAFRKTFSRARQAAVGAKKPFSGAGRTAAQSRKAADGSGQTLAGGKSPALARGMPAVATWKTAFSRKKRLNRARRFG